MGVAGSARRPDLSRPLPSCDGALADQLRDLSRAVSHLIEEREKVGGCGPCHLGGGLPRALSAGLMPPTVSGDATRC